MALPHWAITPTVRDRPHISLAPAGAYRAPARKDRARSTAKELSGHITDSIFERYCISDEKVLADGVAKLSAQRAAHTLVTSDVNQPSQGAG